MHWIALAIAAQSAFSFGTYRDPMDDSETHIAMIGSTKGPGLSITCGPSTNGKLMVMVFSGKRLYSSGNFPGLAKYQDRVRFDSRPATTFSFHYKDDIAFLHGVDALNFISEIKRSQRVIIELDDSRNETFMITLPRSNATDSIDRVKGACHL